MILKGSKILLISLVFVLALMPVFLIGTESVADEMPGLEENPQPEWKESESAAVDSFMSISSTNPVQNRVITNIFNEVKDDIASVKNNGMSHYYPEWESGAWTENGKGDNVNRQRSKTLIYLEPGVYTFHAESAMNVWTYTTDDPSSGGVNIIWRQIGTQTFTVSLRNYIGIDVEMPITQGEPTGSYIIVPTGISGLFDLCEKNAEEVSDLKDIVAYSDGTYNAVLENATLTEDKGIGSGVIAGQVLTLTNDTYSNVLEAPVTAGRKYRLKARVYNGNYLAYFTDDHNVLISKGPQNTTGETYTYIDEIVTAPAGATKIFVAGGKNEMILIDVFNEYTVKDIINMETPAARGAFCIMEFNVGDWYEGRWRDEDRSGAIPPDETIYNNYMSLFNNIFERYKPDISLINEDAQEMCLSRHDDSRAFLGQYYRNMYRAQVQNQTHTKVYNTIASAYPLFDVSTHYFADTESNMTRNWLKGYTYLNGKKVCIICTHLSSDWEKAKLNATELLNAIIAEDPEYLICCGDFNLYSSVAEVKAYEKAGYVLYYGNVEYEGHTYGPGDFIITTPNIVVRSVFCDEQKIESSFVEYLDHLPTLAYLEIF